MSRNDRLSVGAAVPGVALRALALVVAVTAGIVLGVPSGWLMVIAVAAIIGGVFPLTAGVWVAAAVLVGAYIQQSADVVPLVVTIAAVHLLHVLGAFSLVARPSSRVTLRALRPTLLRFTVTQVVGQSLGVAGLALLSDDGRQSLFVLAGGAAALALITGGVWAWQRQRLPAFSQSDH